MKPTTTNTPRRPKPGSQLGIVLRELKAAAPEFVALDHLMREARCGATHSAIARLRTMGHRIENRQSTVRGLRHSEYRLILDGSEVES